MDRQAGALFQRPVGTPEQLRWVHGIVYCVLVLNLLDAVFTMLWVSLGLAREANPLLESLISRSPVLFVCAKLALVGLGSLLLWRHREHPLPIVGIFAAFLVYYWVLVYHVGFLSLLVRNSLGG